MVILTHIAMDLHIHILRELEKQFQDYLDAHPEVNRTQLLKRALKELLDKLVPNYVPTPKTRHNASSWQQCGIDSFPETHLTLSWTAQDQEG